MKRVYPHLSSILFNNPLMVAETKLDEIIGTVGHRILTGEAPLPAAYFDDEDDDEMSAAEPERDPYPDGIATIPVVGSLVKRRCGMDALSGLASYETIQQSFLTALNDPAAKGILVDFDTNGGECAGVFDLADLFFASRGIKPIIAVANDRMMSAGYLLGSACDEIVITQTSQIGSIGVVARHCDQSKYDAKQGFEFTTLTYGSKKAELDPHQPLSDSAREGLQAEIDRLGDKFVAKVSRYRNLSADAVKDTQAGVFAEGDAIKLGLADHIGTRDTAMALLKKRCAVTATVPSGGPPRTPATSSVEAPASADANQPKEGTLSQTGNPQADAANTGTTPNAEDTNTSAFAAAQAAFEARADEIADLCAMARVPEKALGYVRGKMTVAQIRKELAAAGATRGTTAEEISSHVQVDAPPPAATALIDACKARAAKLSTGNRRMN